MKENTGYRMPQEEQDRYLSAMNQPVIDAICTRVSIAIEERKRSGMSPAKAKEAVILEIRGFKEAEILQTSDEILEEGNLKLIEAVHESQDGRNFTVDEAKKFVVEMVHQAPEETPKNILFYFK